MIAESNFYYQETKRCAANRLSGDHPVFYGSGIVTGLSFDLLSNRTYKIDYNLQYLGDTSAEGLSLCLSGTSPALFCAGDGYINDNNSTPEAFIVTGYNHVASHSHGTTHTRPVLFTVLIENSGQNSSLHLLASKESSGPAILNLRKESWATLFEV